MISKAKTIIRGLPALLAFLCAVAAPAAAAEKNFTVFPDDRTLGDPKAPIVMIEYGAPTCPHCAHFATTVLPLVKQHYIDSGKVYYVLRIFPLMAADGAVAGMAKCLPADRYFSFLELAFRRQELWDPEYGVDDVKAGLVKLGDLAGMNRQTAARCMDDKQEWERLNRISQDGDAKYGIAGVPFFVIDGTALRAGEVGWPQLQSRFDALLAKGR